MANLLILAETPIASMAVSRGSGADNLLTPDPKEIWLDSDVGSAATIDIDFGSATVIDTVFLGCVANAAPNAIWTITCGGQSYTEVTLLNEGVLRVPDRQGRTSSVTHAFWTGSDALARYLRIAITQPAASLPLSIGALMSGQSFKPQFNNEWGAGRGVVDTGVVTRLPSGGIFGVEGARYGTFKWAFGDLTTEETDALYEMQLDRGESRRVLVVEDPEMSAGLRNRLHYGLFTSLRSYERRNPKQTRWEFMMNDLVTETAEVSAVNTGAIITLNGEPLTFAGNMMTVGS